MGQPDFCSLWLCVVSSTGKGCGCFIYPWVESFLFLNTVLMPFFFKGFFWCGPFLKSLLNLLQILLLFYVLVFWPGCMWDLSSQTSYWTCSPHIGRQSLVWVTEKSHASESNWEDGGEVGRAGRPHHHPIRLVGSLHIVPWALRSQGRVWMGEWQGWD